MRKDSDSPVARKDHFLHAGIAGMVHHQDQFYKVLEIKLETSCSLAKHSVACSAVLAQI